MKQRKAMIRDSHIFAPVGIVKIKLFGDVERTPDFAAIVSPRRQGVCSRCGAELWSTDGRETMWLCRKCEPR